MFSSKNDAMNWVRDYGCSDISVLRVGKFWRVRDLRTGLILTEEDLANREDAKN